MNVQNTIEIRISCGMNFLCGATCALPISHDHPGLSSPRMLLPLVHLRLYLPYTWDGLWIWPGSIGLYDGLPMCLGCLRTISNDPGLLLG